MSDKYDEMAWSWDSVKRNGGIVHDWEGVIDTEILADKLRKLVARTREEDAKILDALAEGSARAAAEAGKLKELGMMSSFQTRATEAHLAAKRIREQK